MTRLRWTTYDRRGPSWATARVRIVALGLVFALTAVGALTAASTSGRAEDISSTPTADLTALEQRHRAEIGALMQAYDRSVLAIKGEGERALARLRVSLGQDLAGLTAAAADTAKARDAELLAAREAARARRLPDEAEVHARFGRDRTAINGFFQEVLVSLGTADKVPTVSLDAVKKSLESRRTLDLAAMEAMHKTETAALQDKVRAAVTALDQDATRLETENQTQRSSLDSFLDSGKRGVIAETTVVLGQVDADTATLKARHAQELLDLAELHAGQRNAAVASAKSVRDALEVQQRAEKDELVDQHAAELTAQAVLRKGVTEDGSAAVAALETQHQSDREAAEAAYRQAKDNLTTLRSATAADGAARTKLMDESHAAAVQALRNTYAAAITGLSRGRAGVQDGWTARLVRLADDEAKSVSALIVAADLEIKRIEGTFAQLASVAERLLASDRRDATRASELDRGRLERGQKTALLRARLDLNRRLRLADSEYFTFKIRAVAFLQEPGAFTSVSSAYDPATDPGSLYNVARRIGVSELPAGVTGRGVDIALVDTGVVDVPGLAEADVQIGPDFSFEDAIPELRGRDTMGHGTHLGGIIDGRDAAWSAGDRQRRPDRFLGIAPDARLISVKAGAADGAVDVTQIIAAINWVIANKNTDGRNIRVINLSFGTDGVQDYRTDPLTYAVERAWRAGIVVVVAGGNDGWAATGLTNPAQDPFVLAVGSSQAVDGKESVPSVYSNGALGGRTVDLSAPGRSIVSLRNPGSSSDQVNEAGRAGERFVRASGTSQAAAVTSAAVALLLSARSDLTPDQVKQVLMRSAARDDQNSQLVGAGYLRVDRAIKAAIPVASQQWQPSDGSGSMDGARGSVRVVNDGMVLEGDLDIFGHSWAGAKWSEDSWTGTKWSADSWTGAKWSGAKWSNDLWTAASWTGAKWSADSWTGAKWSGAKWSADSWTGAKWSGAKWSAGGWFGAGWGDGPDHLFRLGEEPVTPEALALAAAVG